MNSGLAPSIRRGFFCSDSSIRYPFKPDTIGVKALFSISLILPAIAIKFCDVFIKRLCAEYIFNRSRKRQDITDIKAELNDKLTSENEQLLFESNNQQKRKQLLVNEDESDRVGLRSDTISQSAEDHVDGDSDDLEKFSHVSLSSETEGPNDLDSSLTKPFGDCNLFLFGYCVTMFLSGLGKMSAGRLRPHFFSRCIPNVDCKSVNNMETYIEEFKCTNSHLKPRDYTYITTSWPSGHAAVMFYSMIFTIIYLNNVLPLISLVRATNKLHRQFNHLLPFAGYSLMVGLALYVSLTRVSDYHHHPTDVLSGSIIGAVIALLLARYLKRNEHLRLLLNFVNTRTMC